MTGELNFWDIEVWRFVIMLGILFGALLFANMLRRLIPPLRRSLIPSAVLGGFFVLIVDRVYRAATGDSIFTQAALEALTYHGLGLGVVAMSFRTSDKTRHGGADIFNSGLLTVTGYLLQGILGLAISLGLFYLIGSYFAAGMLLPMGYGQGPGQAYNWGHIFQTYTEYPAFENGTSFGLCVAAMGFISASVGGVYYLNRLKRQGKIKNLVLNADEVEDLTAEMVTAKGEIPLSESLDKLTVQFALILVAYTLTFAFMWYVSKGLDSLGGIFANTVKPLIWGFNFLVGILFAGIVKGVMGFFKKKGLIKREYTNNFLLSRVSGLMFDVMVVAAVAAIDLTAFRHHEFIIPLAVICAVGLVSTYVFTRFVSDKLFPAYASEEFLVMYGMLTGTVSTGLILLREIDPLYETPAAGNLIYQNLWAIVFGFPMLLLMGVVGRSVAWSWITLAVMAVLFAAMMVLLFRSVIFRRKAPKAGKG